MARTVPVDDPADPRLSDYTRLRDVQLRRVLEVERGLFLAEGDKVVRRAIAAGHRPRSFLLAPRWVEPLRDVLDAAGDAPCFVGDEQVLAAVTGFHVHRGVLASMQRAPLPVAEEVLRAARTVAVLEDLVDPTNLGAVFRSAAALGVDAVLLSPRCADPLYRRAAKTSMGAVFSLPYARLQRWYDVPPWLRDMGFRVLALTPDPAAEDIGRVPAGGRLALLLGSEGNGVSPRWLAEADQRVRVPMAAGMDSLNVAAAAAIAFYVLGRSR